MRFLFLFLSPIFIAYCQSSKCGISKRRSTNLYVPIKRYHWTPSNSRKFITKRVLLAKKPFEIDVGDPQNFRQIDELYLGAKVEMLINSLKDLSPGVLLKFRKKCLQFYIKLYRQIQKKSRLQRRDSF